MAQPPLMAWSYEVDDIEHTIDVVFARSRAGAQVLAAGQLGCDWDDVEVTHRPEFDQYAKRTGVGALTQEQFFDAGYIVVCEWCEHRIDGRGDTCWRCEEHGHPEQFPFAEDGLVFCGEWCRDAFHAKQERVQTRKMEASREFYRRQPRMAVTHIRNGSPGCGCLRHDPDNIMITFAVPGGELTSKTRAGNHWNNSYCHGCKRIWVANGDYEAFQALQSETRKAGA